MPADMLKLVPVINNAAIPPIIAKGTFSSTMPASFILPNMTNKIRKMSSRLTGTTCARRFVALCWFSKSPAQTISFPLSSCTASSTFFCASAMVLPISLPLTENFTALYLRFSSLKIILEPVVLFMVAILFIGTWAPLMVGTIRLLMLSALLR